MYAVGNHEQHCDSKFENYKERFSKIPGKISGGGNFYYSFVNLFFFKKNFS